MKYGNNLNNNIPKSNNTIKNEDHKQNTIKDDEIIPDFKSWADMI